MEPGFARNIMSAPVRRPPYRLLRSGKFRSIPKLDFSLTDVDNAPLKEAVVPRQTAGREVLDSKNFVFPLPFIVEIHLLKDFICASSQKFVCVLVSFSLLDDFFLSKVFSIFPVVLLKSLQVGDRGSSADELDY